MGLIASAQGSSKALSRSFARKGEALAGTAAGKGAESRFTDIVEYYRRQVPDPKKNFTLP